MAVDRREFLQVAASALAFAASPRGLSARALAPPRIKAVAFDAFPIFDGRSVLALAEKLFPGKGVELGNLWRTRQFEYQWLRALSGTYADFWKTTEDSLVFACTTLKLELSDVARTQLMNAYLTLKAWPDVSAALRTLKQSGVRLALLSNMTRNMLETNIQAAGLHGLFDQVLSSDQIRSYKPDPRVYQLGVDALKLKREDILFAAFAGWDTAGAKNFGYPTYWVNRLQAPAEVLGVLPDRTGSDLSGLVSFVTQHA